MKLLQRLRQNITTNSIIYLVIFLSIASIPLIWILSSNSTESIIKKELILFADNKKKWTIICDSLKNIEDHLELSNRKSFWVIYNYEFDGSNFEIYSYNTEHGDERLIALRKYLDYLYPNPTKGFDHIKNYINDSDTKCFIKFHTTTLDIYHNAISIIYSNVSADSIKKVFSDYDFCDSINPPTQIGKWLYKLEDNWYIYSP